ncbi:MAG: hypothetical protein PVJ49_11035 [Acidobacteriota bacterium]
MRTSPLARPLGAMRLLAATAILLGSCACASSQTAQAVAVAPALAIAALSGGLDDNGEFVAYLADGRKLEGRWRLVTRQSEAAKATIETPHGQVSPEDLVGPDLPAFLAEVEGPPLAMMCALSGDDSSGYQCRCVDQRGIEWVGSLGRYQYVFNPASDTLVVALREAADCRSCDGGERP